MECWSKSLSLFLFKFLPESTSLWLVFRDESVRPVDKKDERGGKRVFNCIAGCMWKWSVTHPLSCMTSEGTFNTTNNKQRVLHVLVISDRQRRSFPSSSFESNGTYIVSSWVKSHTHTDTTGRRSISWRDVCVSISQMASFSFRLSSADRVFGAVRSFVAQNRDNQSYKSQLPPVFSLTLFILGMRKECQH